MPSPSDWYIDTAVTMPGTKPTNWAESWSEEVPVLPAAFSRRQADWTGHRDRGGCLGIEPAEFAADEDSHGMVGAIRIGAEHRLGEERRDELHLWIVLGVPDDDRLLDALVGVADLTLLKTLLGECLLTLPARPRSWLPLNTDTTTSEDLRVPPTSVDTHGGIFALGGGAVSARMPSLAATRRMATRTSNVMGVATRCRT